MVKYEWDKSNGVSVPTSKLMAIESDAYYVGMPLKRVDADTVAPTDGVPEYICMAQRNEGDELVALQVPVQEVFPDAVYMKINDDGSEELVRFGGSKITPEQLPDGYPYEKEIVSVFIDEDVTVTGSYYEDSQFYYEFRPYLPEIKHGVTYDVTFMGETFEGLTTKGCLDITLSNGAKVHICRSHMYSDSNDGLARPFTTRLKIVEHKVDVVPMDQKFLPFKTAIIQPTFWNDALAGKNISEEELENTSFECVNMTYDEALKCIKDGGGLFVIVKSFFVDSGRNLTAFSFPLVYDVNFIIENEKEYIFIGFEPGGEIEWTADGMELG